MRDTTGGMCGGGIQLIMDGRVSGSMIKNNPSAINQSK